MKKLVFLMIIGLSTPFYGEEFYTRSEVFTEQGIIWSQKLGIIPIFYEYRSVSVLDNKAQNLFMIKYSKGIDYTLYFDYKALNLFLEAIEVYKAERLELSKKEEFQNFYLGYFDYKYLDESAFGAGQKVASNPQLNYSVSYRQKNYYLELDPLSTKSDSYKIDPDTIYFSDSQIEQLEKFIQTNNIVELLATDL